MPKIAKITIIVCILVFIGSYASQGKTNDTGAASPNVLMIVADDLGWADTTLYGHTKFYRTPNVERLAERGMLGQARDFLTASGKLQALCYKEEIEAFDAADQLFPVAARTAGRIKIVQAKTTYHLAPFIEMMHRSARTAFELFACRQSPQAWAAMRPFVEAPIVMGKWIDDPQNAVIWQSRHAGKSARKQYHDAYGGSNLLLTNLTGHPAVA